MTILIVEDHPIMRSTLCDLLKLEGYQIVTAADGREALTRLEEFPIDLVLTDCLMPNMDGLTLLQTLRDDERYSGLPIIMFTANGDLLTRARALAQGADAFLVRPITFERVTQAIKIGLSRR